MDRMPPQTNRAHTDVNGYRDTKKFIRDAGRKTKRMNRFRRKGNKLKCYADCNVQALLNEDALAHWADTHGNGLDWIQVGNKREPFPNRMLDTITGDEWTSLRWTKRRGLSWKSRAVPLLFHDGVEICKNNNVIGTWELKHPWYANVGRVRRMFQIATASGATSYCMALASMKHCREKCAAVITVGWQFAVLAHNEPKPTDFDAWSPKPTRVWGNWKGQE